MTTYTIGTISEDGELVVKLPDKLPPGKHRVVVVVDTVLEATGETALLSEAALSDWNRPEEDEAWQHLQEA